MFQWKRISVNESFRVLLDFLEKNAIAIAFWCLPGHDRRLHPYTRFRQRDFGSCLWQSSEATRSSLVGSGMTPGGHFGGKLWKFWTGFYHINHLGGVRVKRSGVECTNFKTQYFISLSHDKKQSRWDDTKWNEHRFVEPDVLTFVLRKRVTKPLLVWLVLVTILFSRDYHASLWETVLTNHNQPIHRKRIEIVLFLCDLTRFIDENLKSFYSSLIWGWTVAM